MVSEIDPKVRGIYYIMLNRHLFVVDPSDNKKYVWVRDGEAAEEICKVSDAILKGVPTKDIEGKKILIAQELVRKLKEEKSNEVG